MTLWSDNALADEFSVSPRGVSQPGPIGLYLETPRCFPFPAWPDQRSITMFKAEITVTLRPSILDPQGKAAQHALGELGFDSVRQVRIGKVIALDIEADTAAEAERIAKDAADKLLANPVMEDFDVVIHERTSA